MFNIINDGPQSVKVGSKIILCIYQLITFTQTCREKIANVTKM